jgi:hypothetical protein
MRVWIDLSNSPHPLLFAPVTRRLRDEGHEVLFTARDNAQTVELARQRWPEVEVIGGQSPKDRRAKLAAIYDRMASLRRWARACRPQVALSHNSYAQIVAARSLRIPSVTAMDFEHQPANHLAFRLARTVLLPAVLTARVLRYQGARPGKIVRFPGLKEELYIGDFEPDPQIAARVGLAARPPVLVVARTPPSRAVYHHFDNPLFEDALRTVCAQAGVTCVALTRHPEQVAALQALGLPNLVVPRSAVDSRSLMYAADAMIGAGGTMTREAALMGTPTWTLFAGDTPQVDRWLEQQGRLRRLTDPAQLQGLAPSQGPRRTPADLRGRSRAIEDVFLAATVAAAG